MALDTIEERQQEIEQIHAEIFGSPEQKINDRERRFSHGRGLDDQQLIDKASAAKNGDKFYSLFSGNWEGNNNSQSEADLSLCNTLAFWSGCNADQMDRIFRMSSLMRDKWDEKHSSNGSTYGQMTIQKAINNGSGTYQEPQKKELKQKTSGTNDNLQCITLENIFTEKLKENPIIQDLLNEQDQTIIFAPGGVGKSLITQDISMAVGSNMKLLWDLFNIPKPRVSLFVQSENSRLAIHQRTTMKCADNPDYLIGLQNIIYASQYGNIQVAGHVTNETFRNKLISFAKKVEDENEFKIDLIIFDPLISYHDAEENDNSRMRTTLDCILQISNEIEATPIVVHHANKEEGIRGASAIYDWARNIIKLKDVSYRGEKRIKFTHEKCNNTKMFKPFTLAVDENLNFSPLDFSELMPKREKERGLKVKEALELLGGKVDTKVELVEQYKELTGIETSPTIHRHIDQAFNNGFIQREYYMEGKLKKARFYLE